VRGVLQLNAYSEQYGNITAEITPKARCHGRLHLTRQQCVWPPDTCLRGLPVAAAAVIAAAARLSNQQLGHTYSLCEGKGTLVYQCYHQRRAVLYKLVALLLLASIAAHR
jgi:hypothetical protein